MAVYQVEEYYIYMDGIPEDKHEEIEELLSSEGFSDYVIESDLRLDGILSNSDAEDLDQKINEILGRA